MHLHPGTFVYCCIYSTVEIDVTTGVLTCDYISLFVRMTTVIHH